MRATRDKTEKIKKWIKTYKKLKILLFICLILAFFIISVEQIMFTNAFKGVFIPDSTETVTINLNYTNHDESFIKIP